MSIIRCITTAEAAADREVEQEIAGRLAALEAADPSQQRPKRVPGVWDRVDFMEWETEEDLQIIDWPWPKEMLP